MKCFVIAVSALGLAHASVVATQVDKLVLPVCIQNCYTKDFPADGSHALAYCAARDALRAQSWACIDACAEADVVALLAAEHVLCGGDGHDIRDAGLHLQHKQIELREASPEDPGGYDHGNGNGNGNGNGSDDCSTATSGAAAQEATATTPCTTATVTTTVTAAGGGGGGGSGPDQSGSYPPSVTSPGEGSPPSSAPGATSAAEGQTNPGSGPSSSFNAPDESGSGGYPTSSSGGAVPTGPGGEGGDSTSGPGPVPTVPTAGAERAGGVVGAMGIAAVLGALALC